ncbi:DNA gyrase subunit A [Sinimarinibacterium sp. NLF-5-8]|uniref:DNA gyrase subunit A n=1 Tax=Sinimarinibacterium sp. NLF-5-8 TaxID=2698684 RepID=UPI00137BD6C7|nr:DNA gyrase subunit A [Sinimarinibacterium sp. NLF-5-8]QHS09444.1 DNA gyrase subunit A [Sinimarinibacterium sp. NLF-5-8]
MTDFAKEIVSVNLEDEMRRSYLDYAMSVIVGRALPDARDGLKPVHRRVLFAMKELGNDFNKPYKKSARIVGDVIGKYHPHGDIAVYDTMVRMAQDFSMRYMLVDGQGNFGSVDGDAPAAMRYTEVRMAKLAHELLADIDKDTVDYQDNYDGSEREPSVLPTRVPQLLINGSAGIAVGMATNIPPHNLSEVINGCVALIDQPEIGLDELMQYIPAPDFPTAGLLLDVHGLKEAYATGRGRVIIRARTHFETIGHDKQAIIVTELPYQVNKARLLEKIAELVKEKRIEGITEMRDESDKDGTRMVLELRRGENADVVLNNLYQLTQLQDSFNLNMVALDGGQPRLLSLKELLEIFVRHRREVVTRRTRYLLRKARERAHVLEGLSVALANIDDIIQLIRTSPSPAEAKKGLMERIWKAGPVTAMLARAGSDASRPQELGAEFGIVDGGYRLSEAQAQAILDLRLHRLTGLEQDKIHDEFKNLLDAILDYLDILGSDERLLSVIRGELLEIKEQYGDERRSEITNAALNMAPEDLIPPQDMVVTLSHEGYVKAVVLDEYQAQKRGGRGKVAATTKEEDFVDRLWVAHSHDTLLCFSSLGKCYKLRVFELPSGSRGSRGKPFNNLLPLEQNEKINAVLPIKSFDDAPPNATSPDQIAYIFMVTRRGTVKKTELAAFKNVRANGIIAVDLRIDDELVGVALTSGSDDVILIADSGRAIRFNEGDVRSMGRGATGVRGMRLLKTFAASDEGEDERADEAEGDDDNSSETANIIALIVADGGEILTVSEFGYGKRTPVAQYPLRGRGGQGVIGQALSDKTGRLVGALSVTDDDEVMLISEAGILIRFKTTDVRTMSRNTQGVRLMRPDKNDRLVSAGLIVPDDDDAEEIEGGEDQPGDAADQTLDHSDNAGDAAPDNA